MRKTTALRKVEKVEVEVIPAATGSLAEHEAVIERGMSSFIEIGKALEAIKKDKEYQQIGYKTFEEYCQKRWSWTRAHCYYQIAAAGAAENLSTIVDKSRLRETHIRPLVSLEPDVQRKVWQQAVETAPKGKLTAKIVSEIAAEYKEKKPESKQAFNPNKASLKVRKAIRAFAQKWPYENRAYLSRVLREYADAIDNIKPEFMS